MKTLTDYMVDAIRKTSEYDPNVQVPPVCILWTDDNRQWEPLIPELRELIPELLVLGEYRPEEKTGPAIWLRCALAGSIPNIQIPIQSTPVLYLPGIKRQNLRAIDQCDESVKAIAELQFRGKFWCRESSKDWTLLAFLQTNRGGLNLDVAQDT